MPTLNQVQEKVKKIGVANAIFGRREIKALPDILWDNENIENIVQGFYKSGNGILVATDRRLVFVSKGMIYGLDVEDFPYEKITSVQYKTGLLMGRITIFASGNKADISNIEKKSAKNFGDYIQAKLNRKDEVKSISSTTGNINPVAELEKLAALKHQGLLSDDEFSEMKRRILNQ